MNKIIFEIQHIKLSELMIKSKIDALIKIYAENDE